MASLTDVFVTVRPDVDKFGPEVKSKLRRIDASAEGKRVGTGFGKGLSSPLGGIGKSAAKLFIGGFAVLKGAELFKSVIEGARESARVTRQSEAVIRSTGAVAGISAKQMGELATSLSNKTGADDEAIQSGENLMATFTGVRNEAGRGNDIFNRATASAVDLAAAMNHGVVDANGLQKANIQLGKALNDPVKGITALSRVGVSFTAQQKAQIKTMVESGDKLGAQKIILAEMSKEFGGAAAAAADPLTRLRTIADNLGEKVGGFLLPKIGQFATFLATTAIPAIGRLSDRVNEFVHSSGFQEFLRNLGDIARSTFGFFRDNVLPILLAFGGFLVNTVIPAVATLIGWLARHKGVLVTLASAYAALVTITKVHTAVMAVQAAGGMVKFLTSYLSSIRLVQVATRVWTALQWALNIAMRANPIGLVLTALTLLVVGLVIAYKRSETFRNIVNGAFNAVKVVAGAVLNWLSGAVRAVIAFVSSSWQRLHGILTHPVASARAALASIWAGIVKVFSGARDWALGAFRATWALLSGILSSPINAAKNTISAIWGQLKQIFIGGVRFIVKTFLDGVGWILDGAVKMLGWVPGVGGKLRAAQNAFGHFRDDVNNKLAGIKDQTINIAPKLVSKFLPSGIALNTPSRAGRLWTGGPVRGPGSTTSDEAGLFALSDKEWVIKAASAQAYGDDKMKAVNEGRATIIADGYLAAGGRAKKLDVNARIPSGKATGAFASSIAAQTNAYARPYAQRMVDNLMAQLLASSSGGMTSTSLNGALAWARTQVGKPYLWGGVGPGGYDCSGAVAAMINKAQNKNPYHRLGSTKNMPWPSMGAGTGPFMVGWTNAGVGHTAMTVNGVNVESSGGRGFHMGAGARGAFDPMFTNHAQVKGFKADGIAAGAGGSGGAGVQRWRSVALQALAAAGAPSSWINSLLRRMNQESSGNPNAINRTDSNARAGHPSQGLMQTIPGTFNAYAGAYRGRGITDPFANIYAAIRYTMARYGSGPAGWDRKGGYAKGGKITKADALAMGIGTFDTGGKWKSGTMAANLSGKTETVRTAEQEAALGAGKIGLLTITNWDQGTGYFRTVAQDEVGAASEFNSTMYRMG